MSNINVRRAVENIKSGTNVYTPLIEIIVNAIQAIEARSIDTGKIEIIVKRSDQIEADGGSSLIESFCVIDNGIGFNSVNQQSFDTLYSAMKLVSKKQ